jgi:hypothetical protein
MGGNGTVWTWKQLARGEWMKPNNELYNLYSSNAEYQIKGGWRDGAYKMFGRW